MNLLHVKRTDRELLSAQLLIKKPLGSLAWRNSHNDKEQYLQRLVIRVISKHANFRMHKLIAVTNPHYKHESTPRQTHRQRTSVSPIAYHEALPVWCREVRSIIENNISRGWILDLRRLWHDLLSKNACFTNMHHCTCQKDLEQISSILSMELIFNIFYIYYCSRFRTS